MATKLETEFKEAATVQWLNDTGSAVSADDFVQIGVAPFKYVGIALVDIAANATGSVIVKGRVNVAYNTGTGASIMRGVYMGTAGLTVTGTSVTAFAGYLAEPVTASSTTCVVDLSRARPNFET
jgi:hypothetical protein